MAFVALLDASVLHPWVVCDLLLRLAERGLYRPAWSAEILDELVGSLARRQPEHEMTRQPGRFASAVPDDVDPGDRHVVAAAFAARADVILTNNVRHFAPDRLAESGLLVHTADEFLVHQWWLSIPQGSSRSWPRWQRRRAGPPDGMTLLLRHVPGQGNCVRSSGPRLQRPRPMRSSGQEELTPRNQPHP